MTEKLPLPSSAVPEIDLGHFVGWLVDHKWLIALVMVLFGMGGYLYAGSQPRIYSADSLVQVESENGSLINLPGMSGQVSVEQNRTLTEIGILQSRMVLGEAVDRENLTIRVLPQRLPFLGNFLVNQGVSVPSLLRDRPYVWADEFAEVSRFEVPEGTNPGPYIIRSTGDGGYVLRQGERVLLTGQAGETVHSDDGYRLFVQRLQAHAGAEFVLYRSTQLSAINALKSSLSSHQAEGEWLVNLRLTGSDKTQIEDTLNTIMQVFLAQNIERHSAEADRQLAFLEEQIPQVGERLSASETNLNSYRAQRDSVDLDFETETMLNKLVAFENQMSDIEFQRVELERRFTRNHPTYQALMAKKQQLEDNKAELESRITDLPETQQKILRLERAARVNQEIYVQLLNKQQEMRLVQAGTVGNVRILDTAVVQPSPIAPRSSLIMAISLLMGLLVAIAIVMARYLLNRGIETPKQLEEQGLPVYATVPLSGEQTKLSGGFKAGLYRRQRARLRDLLALRTPTDLSIEALRSLRTSLHFAMLEAGDNRLMLTSPSPAVGKSFISVNLAAVCAQAGQKVLVIDGDMRKGHVHHAFHGDSDGGLSELLGGELTLEGAIRGTAVDGLDYIARGVSPPNPSELLMQPSFSLLMADVSPRYDLVIIDTPPVLAVTDAAIIGKQVGTSLLVARFGMTPRGEIEATMEKLENSGILLKGAILNAMRRKVSTKYSYYTYAYK
ncbi:polysaccharide biosynthesis tyrosine autokinase [Halomonas sp. M4R1S46]|uniref:polysaccharide biosynthesis tyrosine autokinase n=1 Tax=Halomonas sp. M4R1S46 TaxID=2982692 RepID=UPI0021E41CD8|nr:polysaccharide biosynthesis tyrosine autokinase [Halomonas sp. M4R1S46]UYG06330.1 polysaccharide biosynthesis tyrosine autokinase [Halomonas sp. M4R1S46]